VLCPTIFRVATQKDHRDPCLASHAARSRSEAITRFGCAGLIVPAVSRTPRNMSSDAKLLASVSLWNDWVTRRYPPFLPEVGLSKETNHVFFIWFAVR
jgi:hypothetical protein